MSVKPSDSNMKLWIATLLMSLLGLANVSGQSTSFAIHVYNPLALFQKAGLKLELKHQRIGILLTGIQYYGVLPKYPGTKGGLEGRYYSKRESPQKHVNFLYGKVLMGYQQHVDASGDGFFNKAEVLAGNYYGGGIGVGRHFNFGPWFFDLNTGLKYTYSPIERHKSFFITGPGSYLDLYFNVGYQF